MGTYASIPGTHAVVLSQNVKGGLITYTADVLDLVNIVTANFAANSTDPKDVSCHSVGRDSGLFLRHGNTACWNLSRISGDSLSHT